MTSPGCPSFTPSKRTWPKSPCPPPVQPLPSPYIAPAQPPVQPLPSPCVTHIPQRSSVSPIQQARYLVDFDPALPLWQVACRPCQAPCCSLVSLYLASYSVSCLASNPSTTPRCRCGRWRVGAVSRLSRPLKASLMAFSCLFIALHNIPVSLPSNLYRSFDAGDTSHLPLGRSLTHIPPPGPLPHPPTACAPSTLPTYRLTPYLMSYTVPCPISCPTPPHIMSRWPWWPVSRPISRPISCPTPPHIMSRWRWWPLCTSWATISSEGPTGAPCARCARTPYSINAMY